MKDAKIPSHQVDVVEIMKKIRQSASDSRSEMTMDERIRRESKSEFNSLLSSAGVPDFLADEIRQQGAFQTYDPRTLYASARPGLGSFIGWIRKILRPITKLFINLDPLAHEVHRLTVLNNFYLKTVQDLVAKNSAMRVEIHWLNKRLGHHRTREESFSHHRSPGQGRNHQPHRNHRRYGRDRQDRRDVGNGSRNAPRTNPTEESQT